MASALSDLKVFAKSRGPICSGRTRGPGARRGWLGVGTFALASVFAACNPRVEPPWDRDFNGGEVGAYIFSHTCESLPPLHVALGRNASVDAFKPFPEGEVLTEEAGALELGVQVWPLHHEHQGFELILQAQTGLECLEGELCEQQRLADHRVVGYRRVFVEGPEVLEIDDELVGRQMDVILVSDPLTTLTAVARDACGRFAFVRH